MKTTVCIATYNGEKYIDEQLSSILSQLNETDEIVISDDGSTDNTTNIIEKYNDKRIILLKNNTFRNPIFNFENAIRKATGDLILLSDQDDKWLPGKVQYYRNRILDFDLIITDCTIVNDEGTEIYHSFFSFQKSGKGFLKNLIQNSYLGCCMGFNRKILKYILPFPKDIPMHDIWIGTVVEMNGKVIFDKEKFLVHRRHKSNFSTTGGVTSSGIFQLVSYRWRIIKYLPLIIWRKYYR